MLRPQKPRHHPGNDMLRPPKPRHHPGRSKQRPYDMMDHAYPTPLYVV